MSLFFVNPLCGLMCVSMLCELAVHFFFFLLLLVFSVMLRCELTSVGLFCGFVF